MKIKVILSLLIICVSCFSGCTSLQKWSLISGSRTDGVVQLSYKYGRFSYPAHVPDEEGLFIAKRRCISWGYNDAQEFGGTTMACSKVYYITHICKEWTMTREYQCTVF